MEGAQGWTRQLRWGALVGVMVVGRGVAFGQEAMGPYPEGKSPAELAAAAAQAAAAERAADKAERQAELQAIRQEAQKALAAERAAREAESARLNAEIAGLRQEAEVARKEAAEAPPLVRAARLGIGLTGFMQADWTVSRQSSEDQINYSTGDPLNEERFTIRRARLKVTLDRTYVAGAFELDGNSVKGLTARIAGAEASLKWNGWAAPGEPPLIMATIGLFKIPFGFEVGQSDRDRLFLERTTTSRALFPGEYDLGARIQLNWRFLRFMGAVQNGDPAGERAFPGRDPNHQKDYIGRVGIDTSGSGRAWIACGFSALYGTGLHKGTPATKPSVQWVDSNEDGIVAPTELKPIPGQSATPSINFPRHGLGADLRLTLSQSRIGETTAYGELYYARDLDRAILVADPTGALNAVGRSYRELGYYLALMQDLGPHATIGFRYDYYNPDRDANDTQLGVIVPSDPSYTTYAFVAALRAPSGRLILEYDVNRNHLARDSAGIPTTQKDNTWTIRGEVRF